MAIKGLCDMRLRRFFASPWSAVLIIVALVALLYGRTLSFEYVWDDSLLFLDKTALLNDPLSWGVLVEPVLPGTTYMRPLVFLTLYAEFQLFGQSPIISHLVNLVLFMVNGVLLFLVSRRIAVLTAQRLPTRIALIASVLYVVHPALVESTAWVSGRFDLMVTLFFLLAVLVYLGGALASWLRISLVSLLMLAALLCKELGVVLPGVLLCVWVACYADPEESPLKTFGRAIRNNAGMLMALVMTFAIYISLRVQAMDSIYHSALTVEYLRMALLELLLPLEALKFYAMQTVLPFHGVNPLHPVVEFEPHSPLNLLGSVVVLALLLVGLAWCWFKRSTSAWLALAGFLCLVPVLHLLPLTIGGNIGHERFMTAPLVFIVMAVVFFRYDLLFSRFSLATDFLRRILSLAGMGWIGLSVWTTSSILPFWSSELQLWNWAYHAHPGSEFARYNYLYGALKDSRVDLVEKEIKKLQAERGGLEVGEQILYANTLIRALDPEGIKYLDGVMLAVPKFHEESDGRERADNFMLTAVQMGGFYADYANGMMVFEGDAAEAFKFNKIAEWYLRESEKIPLYYQRVAILYALGEFAEADGLYRRQESLYYYNKDGVKMAVWQLLGSYCKVNKYEGGSCGELVRRGLVPPSVDSD